MTEQIKKYLVKYNLEFLEKYWDSDPDFVKEILEDHNDPILLQFFNGEEVTDDDIVYIPLNCYNSTIIEKDDSLTVTFMDGDVIHYIPNVVSIILIKESQDLKITFENDDDNGTETAVPQ